MCFSTGANKDFVETISSKNMSPWEVLFFCHSCVWAAQWSPPERWNPPKLPSLVPQAFTGKANHEQACGQWADCSTGATGGLNWDVAVFLSKLCTLEPSGLWPLHLGADLFRTIYSEIQKNIISADQYILLWYNIYVLFFSQYISSFRNVIRVGGNSVLTRLRSIFLRHSSLWLPQCHAQPESLASGTCYSIRLRSSGVFNCVKE